MCNKTVYKMLVKKSYNNSLFNGLFRFRPLSLPMFQNTYLAANNNKVDTKCLLHMPFKTVPLLMKKHFESSILSSMRCHFYCTQNKTPILPKLMEFPINTWPSIIKSVRNWIFANFIIMRYFDSDFNLPDFVNGSKKVG